MERGEGVVGDLRLRGRHGCEERRLAGVRQSDEAGVGDQLEAQDQGPLDPRQTGIGVAGRSVGRGGEVGVAEAAVASLRDDDALALLGKIGQHRSGLFLEHLGAGRNLQHDIGAAAAGAVPAMPCMPVFALKCCW